MGFAFVQHSESPFRASRLNSAGIDAYVKGLEGTIGLIE